VLTDLRNSFAYHFPIAEIYNVVGIDYLIVNTLHIKKGNIKKEIDRS